MNQISKPNGYPTRWQERMRVAMAMARRKTKPGPGPGPDLKRMVTARMQGGGSKNGVDGGSLVMAPKRFVSEEILRE